MHELKKKCHQHALTHPEKKLALSFLQVKLILVIF